MIKLLSLLSVLTVSGTAIPTTVAASSYQNVNCKCKCSTLFFFNKVLHLHLQFTHIKNCSSSIELIEIIKQHDN